MPASTPCSPAQRRIAMQYSPNNDIMYVSMVDAGTVEFLRSLGKEIVSSADLVSQFEAVLSAEQIASHAVAQQAIDAILAEGWQEIGRRLRPPAATGQAHRVRHGALARRSHAPRKSGLGERARRQRERQQLRLALRAHRRRARAIREGDFLLIDIWGRVNEPAPSFTTSPGPASSAANPREREQLVFETVRNARDAAIAAVRSGLCRGPAPFAVLRPTMPPAP